MWSEHQEADVSLQQQHMAHLSLPRFGHYVGFATVSLSEAVLEEN
jgi:hypothetical protein